MSIKYYLLIVTALLMFFGRNTAAWEYKLSTGICQAAPVVDNDTVFVGTCGEGFLAMNVHTGQLRWKFSNKDSDIIAPAYVDKEKVLFGDSDGILHCLDRYTGTEYWTFNTHGTIDNAPNVVPGTSDVLIGSQHGTLYALKNGTKPEQDVVWEYKTGDQIRCVPVIQGQQCFIAGCDSYFHIIDTQTGKGTAKIPLESPTGSTPAFEGVNAYFGTEGNEFLCIDTQRCQVVWRFPLKQSVRSTAVVYNGVVYFGGFDKTIYAVNTKTGETVWQYKTKGRIESGLLRAGSRLFVPSADATLYEFDLTEKIEKDKTPKVHTYSMPGKVLTTPAMLKDSLIITTKESIVEMKLPSR